MYTIKFKEHDQDNVNFIPVNSAEEAKEKSDYFGYEKVLAHSLEYGFIKDISEAKTFCDGGDHVEPYFTSETPEEEVCHYLENASDWNSAFEGEIKFNKDQTEYELF